MLRHIVWVYFAKEDGLITVIAHPVMVVDSSLANSAMEIVQKFVQTVIGTGTSRSKLNSMFYLHGLYNG